MQKGTKYIRTMRILIMPKQFSIILLYAFLIFYALFDPSIAADVVPTGSQCYTIPFLKKILYMLACHAMLLLAAFSGFQYDFFK